MHMDPVAARRLLTGRQVVHGMNILLHAIEYWLVEHRHPPTALKCSFLNPVSVGDRAIFDVVSQTDNDHTIEVTVAGLVCCKIVVATADDPSPAQPVNARDYQATKPHAPLELEATQQLHRKYAIDIHQADLGDAFPLLKKHLPPEYPLALATLSYFVGMICPGMHSIFSALNVKFNPGFAHQKTVFFSVDRFDERFGLFNISVRGPVEGEIRAFQRPPPYRQDSLEALSQYTQRTEFSGTSSLIIGGSRGLGELTAKILASGGGNTIITYASGHSDAMAVRDAIRAGSATSCEALQFDLLADPISSLGLDLNTLDAIYFFATPRIFRKKIAFFDQSLLDEFLESYVHRFYAMCLWLETHMQRNVRIYFPSSIFVETRPRDFTEYAMAKAAAEVLIADINRTFRKVSVLTSRLPRLSTDQTSSVMKLETASNIDALLPIVKSMLAMPVRQP